MNTQHTFQVPGMSCGRCAATITRTLEALGARVMADPATKRVEVSAPTALSREQLAAALSEAGYPPVDG
ncbi:MAG: heavy-metal-associated domain-containing protein [Burkholderiales bacterium]|uniref:heavy-metal-associated domain-containing protein n=1 Tax=Inhella sp. TaxID=1921806 RepID=UPI001ACC41B5|nr:heavy-metal-associated domain-containing protein [Burkholderiales bacterium]